MDRRTRTRLLFLVAFVIVIAAVGVVLLLNQDNTASPPPTPELVQGATAAPQSTGQPAGPTATVIPTQELRQVVVAIQNISRGSVIPPDAVRLQPWPVEALPFSAVLDPEDVIGRIARTDLYQEQPILESQVVDTLDQLAATGSDAAAILPPGTVAVSLPMDRFTSVAYAIQPGDRVDIILSLLFVDMDEDFQTALPNIVNLFSVLLSDGITLGIGPDVNGRIDTRRIPIPYVVGDASTGNVDVRTAAIDWPVVIRPSENPRPRLLTQRTIQDAQVIHIGNFPEDGKLFAEVASPTPVAATAAPAPQQQAAAPTAVPARPDIVTLAVSQQEAVIIAWIVEARVPITFALRSASDRSQRVTDSVTLDYILSEYDITVPRRNDYTIEPAIRSIRRLQIDDGISLSSP